MDMSLVLCRNCEVTLRNDGVTGELGLFTMLPFIHVSVLVFIFDKFRAVLTDHFLDFLDELIDTLVVSPWLQEHQVKIFQFPSSLVVELASLDVVGRNSKLKV